MRSIWTGTISFLLISFNVKLYNAIETSEKISFNQLHSGCNGAIGYTKQCKKCDAVVTSYEIVKGYEYDKGQFVIVTPDEISSIAPKSNESIEVIGFIDPNEVPTTYFDVSYFVAPNGVSAGNAQQTLQQAQTFYRSMKSQVIEHGRSPDDTKILPGVFPVVGRTQSEAEDLYAQLQNLVDPVVGMGLLTTQLGDVDLSTFDLDKPLPELPLTEGSQSKQKLIYEQARSKGLTIRQLYQAVSAGRCHRFLLGTADIIADQLEDWFLNEGSNGFNVLPPYLPNQLTDFVDTASTNNKP